MSSADESENGDLGMGLGLKPGGFARNEPRAEYSAHFTASCHAVNRKTTKTRCSEQQQALGLHHHDRHFNAAGHNNEVISQSKCSNPTPKPAIVQSHTPTYQLDSCNQSQSLSIRRLSERLKFLHLRHSSESENEIGRTQIVENGDRSDSFISAASTDVSLETALQKASTVSQSEGKDFGGNSQSHGKSVSQELCLNSNGVKDEKNHIGNTTVCQCGSNNESHNKYLLDLLQRKEEEVDSLQLLLEASQRQLKAKNQAAWILQHQLRQLEMEQRRTTRELRQRNQKLVQDVNKLQYSLEMARGTLADSQQQWGSRFDCVQRENKDLRDQLVACIKHRDRAQNCTSPFDTIDDQPIIAVLPSTNHTALFTSVSANHISPCSSRVFSPINHILAESSHVLWPTPRISSSTFCPTNQFSPGMCSPVNCISPGTSISPIRRSITDAARSIAHYTSLAASNSVPAVASANNNVVRVTSTTMDKCMLAKSLTGNIGLN